MEDITEQYQELQREYKRVEHSMFHYQEYTEQVKTPLPITELHKKREKLFDEMRKIRRQLPHTQEKRGLDKWM